MSGIAEATIGAATGMLRFADNSINLGRCFASWRSPWSTRS